MPRPRKEAPDLKNIATTADGKYRVDLVRSLPSGQRFRRNTVRTTVEDAIKFRDDALADYERAKAGEALIASNGYSVEEWCDHCLTAVLPTTASRKGKPYSPKTITEYRTVLKGHVYPKVGGVRLTALTVDHVRTAIAGTDSEPLRLNIRKTLSVFMELAEADGKRPLGSNPCRRVRIGVTKVKRTDAATVIKSKQVDPEDGRKKIIVETPVPAGLIVEKVRVLSHEEEAALLTHVRSHPHHSGYETLILLGLRLGLRIGEALGLDWSAVDFDANTVTVDQQAHRVIGKSGVQVGNVKSEAGNRTIPMPRSLAEHLRVVKLLSSSAHVVSNRKGERRDAARVANRLKELMEGCGLNDKVEGRRFLPRPTYHDLRRTCLTRLATGHVAPGVVVTPVPPTVLIRISGHEDVTTLLSYYVNADDSMVTAAMASMP